MSLPRSMIAWSWPPIGTVTSSQMLPGSVLPSAQVLGSVLAGAADGGARDWDLRVRRDHGQAGVGAHVIDVDPVEAKASLVAVAQTSRSALTEVRRILGALRSQGDPATYRPPPGMEAIGDLAAELTASGLPVTVHVQGDRECVPAALALTAYRLVQELLTNVVKHAGPAHAKITVRYEPGALLVDVTDDGRGPSPASEPRPQGTVSSGCVSGSRCGVARSRPGPDRAAATASPLAYPTTTRSRDDPGRLVDDEALVRRGLTLSLRLEPDLELVGEGELPEAVRAAFERRLSVLPDAAQGVVTAASVLGRADDPGTLAAVADLPLDAVLDGTDLRR